MKNPTQDQIDECKILLKRMETLENERMHIFGKIREILGDEIHDMIAHRTEDRIDESGNIIDSRGGTIREQFPVLLKEYFDDLQDEAEQEWLIRVTVDEFKTLARKKYPNMADEEWDVFTEVIDNKYNYEQVFNHLMDYLDSYMELTCPDSEATHRQCVHYTPVWTMPDGETKIEMLKEGIKGTCVEGGLTEISDPDVKLCQHEDGWCTAFKRSQPFATNDLVRPTVKEVENSEIHTTNLQDLFEEFAEDYKIEFHWETKDEYRELHYVVDIYLTEPHGDKKVDQKRYAYIKSHMTGQVKSI